MALAHAYAQDSAGTWLPVRTSAMGDLAGIGGAVIPAGEPQIVAPWSYAAASSGITDTSDVTLVAAAGAGRSNYVTNLQVLNSSATPTEVVIKSGSTVLWRCKVGASMIRPADVEFVHPLIGANNTALTAACITTGTVTYLDVQGYQDETIEQIYADLTAAEELVDASGALIYDEFGVAITLSGVSPITIAVPGRITGDDGLTLLTADDGTTALSEG